VQIRVNRDGLIASFLPSAVFGVQAARDLGRYLRVRDRQPQHHTKGDGDPHCDPPCEIFVGSRLSITRTEGADDFEVFREPFVKKSAVA
jgi:hypothetical protein